MNEKGNSKILGIVFIVVVVVLLFAHFTSVNQIKNNYEKQIKELNTEVQNLEKVSQANLAKIKSLEIKLKINEIKLSVSRNDYGTASVLLKKFNDELAKAGCKKLEQLTPVFDAIDTKLLKLDKTVVEDLGQIENIIFSEQAEKKVEEKKEETK